MAEPRSKDPNKLSNLAATKVAIEECAAQQKDPQTRNSSSKDANGPIQDRSLIYNQLQQRPVGMMVEDRGAIFDDEDEHDIEGHDSDCKISPTYEGVESGSEGFEDGDDEDDKVDDEYVPSYFCLLNIGSPTYRREVRANVRKDPPITRS